MFLSSKGIKGYVYNEQNSSNSEASASELLKNLKDAFPCYWY